MSYKSEKKLQKLVDDALDLGREVEECLSNMVQAVEHHDYRFAVSNFGIDSRSKLRGVKIDEECMILQARQALVASDLRLLYTVQSVTRDVVRVRTLCEHICRTIVEIEGHDRDENLAPVLLEMTRASQGLFQRGLEIFRKRDIARARDLQAAHGKVELLHLEAMNHVANPTADSPEWRMTAGLVLHYLKCIGDHSVGIGGRTFFLVTGERMESAMHQYLNAYPNGVRRAGRFDHNKLYCRKGE